MNLNNKPDDWTVAEMDELNNAVAKARSRKICRNCVHVRNGLYGRVDAACDLQYNSTWPEYTCEDFTNKHEE